MGHWDYEIDSIPGWWCNNHLEKYEFVNGKDDIPYTMDNTIHDYVIIPLINVSSGILTIWTIKVMLQTTNQLTRAKM